MIYECHLKFRSDDLVSLLPLYHALEGAVRDVLHDDSVDVRVNFEFFGEVNEK